MKSDEGCVPHHGANCVILVPPHISKLSQVSGFRGSCKHVYVEVKNKRNWESSESVHIFKDGPSTNLFFVPHLNYGQEQQQKYTYQVIIFPKNTFSPQTSLCGSL